MPDAPTAESIQQQLCSEIQTLLSLKSGSVNSDTHLPSLGIDSLRFVSLLLVIEQKFGVNLMKAGLKPDDTKSVRNLASVIVARRSA
ncbi:MAG: acyl carrier protein [Tepidisphaeraceae bacterium]|jgi:acyl carrier protein